MTNELNPHVSDGVATIKLTKYEDLLTVRGLPEWRFVSDDTIQCDARHLYSIGLANHDEGYEWGDHADHLFDYQRWVVDRALERERFAAFLTTGLGKTAIQLEWARHVAARSGGRVLIVAPLNIVRQTANEASKFYGDSFTVADLRNRADLDEWCRNGSGVAITNYEKLDGETRPLSVDGVVLDESSILKNSNGVRRQALVAAFQGVRWKLACSATPAPNDRVEYAEHAYWLGIVRSTREFLAAFFVNRDGDWQLKAHGAESFYNHLAAWSVFMVDPEHFRFTGTDTTLPPLNVSFPHVDSTVVQQERSRQFETGSQASLFGATPGGITSRTKLMQIANGFLLDGGKASRFDSHKPTRVAELANDTHGDEQVIVWVTFDEEGDHLETLIPDSVHISGRTKVAERDRLIDEFCAGNSPRVLILKPSMFGFGLNMQTCRVQVFSSITDSFERYFQSVRRSWRFGQNKAVNVYIPTTGFDEAIIQNVMNKQSTYEEDAKLQESAFVRILRPRDSTEKANYMPDMIEERDRTESDSWTMVNADSIVHMEHVMEPQSVDLAVFSPPFANLFTYSSEAGDMGNVKSDPEYRLQWKWFAERIMRVMKPGRIVAVHCMDVIRFAGTYGHRHTYDYPSDLRAGMEDAGFLYRARISIDKNPQIQATRTKDQNLLFATLVRNALDSHPQAGEYVLVFSAPGEPETPVLAPDVTNQEWIRWAHHVWYDIRETDVLNAALGKEDEDERHICPLQLGLIERCVRLWSNPGETVFSPFAGIGSEGHEAISWGRKFYGVELKEAYYRTACKFLSERESELETRLFDTTSVVA